MPYYEHLGYYTTSREPAEADDWFDYARCESCNSLGGDGEIIVACDKCNRAYHQSCLGRKVVDIGEEDEFKCNDCSKPCTKRRKSGRSGDCRVQRWLRVSWAPNFEPTEQLIQDGLGDLIDRYNAENLMDITDRV